MIWIFFVLSLAVSIGADLPCIPVEKKSGFVCVCNSSYCDTIETPSKLEERQFHIYSTSKNVPGFSHDIGFFKMQSFAPHGVKLEINDDKKRQKIVGFGGSFTDSVGYLLNSLSEGTRTNFLKSYFSTSGVEYSHCRVVLGSCDFSLRPYNYAPNYDPSLKSFNFTEDDFKYKISHIQRANKMSKRKINYLGTLWSAPHWMKRNNASGLNYLHPKFRQTLADYYIKTFDTFKANGIEFWGMTPGNEPITLIGFRGLVGMDITVVFPEEQRDFIADYLGPSLESAGYKNFSIVLLDDMRYYSQWWMDTVMRSSKAKKYVAGVGLHWYLDSFYSPKILDQIKEKYPEKNIYYTETSINPFFKIFLDAEEQGTFPTNVTVTATPPDLGSWKRATLYISNIFENLKHWTSGYIDWNLGLDLEGGPNLINMTCDAPVIINVTADEFYKQPLFYAMGHFAKFIHPNAVFLESDITSSNQESDNNYAEHQSTVEKLLIESKYQAPNTDVAMDNYEDNEEILYPEEVQHSARKVETITVKPTQNVAAFPTLLQYRDVTYVAVLNPDGSHSVIIYNPRNMAMEVSIHDVNQGYGFLILEPESITSVVY